MKTLKQSITESFVDPVFDTMYDEKREEIQIITSVLDTPDDLSKYLIKKYVSRTKRHFNVLQKNKQHIVGIEKSGKADYVGITVFFKQGFELTFWAAQDIKTVTVKAFDEINEFDFATITDAVKAITSNNVSSGKSTSKAYGEPTSDQMKLQQKFNTSRRQRIKSFYKI